VTSSTQGLQCTKLIYCELREIVLCPRETGITVLKMLNDFNCYFDAIIIDLLKYLRQTELYFPIRSTQKI